MGKLIGLLVSLVQCDKDAKIVFPRCDFNTCASELGRDLIEATGSDTLFGTVNVKGRNWRMMGGLLGKIGDSDMFIRLRRSPLKGSSSRRLQTICFNRW